jgi:hypothetical protein
LERIRSTGDLGREAARYFAGTEYFFTIHSGCHWSVLRSLPVTSIGGVGVLLYEHSGKIFHGVSPAERFHQLHR